MRPLTQMFALPATLLLLIATFPARVPAQDLQWPYNLPAHVKYHPEDEALVRRDIEVRKRFQRQPAVGVRKMSDDPGEMFFLDYWWFGPEEESDTTTGWDEATAQKPQLQSQHANDSLPVSLRQPFPLHSDRKISDSSLTRRHVRISLFGRSLFDRRGFQCPTGTAACTNLNPNVCCAAGETCITVQDTGLGTVGCCPKGETCAGSLSACPSGYSSCPNNTGGGCCIPGYACYDVGCVISSTATVYVAPTAAASSTTRTPTLPGISTTTTTLTKTTSKTSTITRTTCTYGFQSCASSLGGGCCPNNMVCGSSTCFPRSSTVSVVAPYRPTSVGGTTTTMHSSIPGGGCPTGYYACLAYYPGRCCQSGRDCSRSSCPIGGSATLVNSNGLTIIAPTGSGVSRNSVAITGACASGWVSCAVGFGGGCCPAGYACGTGCTATASGGQGYVVGKTAPNSSTRGSLWQDIWCACGAILAVMLYYGS